MSTTLNLAIVILTLLSGSLCTTTEAEVKGNKNSYLLTPNDALAKRYIQDGIDSVEYVRAVRESLQQLERHKQLNKHPRSKRAIKRVCYGELGCFEDSGPFAYLEMLPSSPEEINTKFYFYSTKNRSDRPLMELPFLNMTDEFYKLKKSSVKRSTDDHNHIMSTADLTNAAAAAINTTLITSAPVTTSTTTTTPKSTAATTTATKRNKNVFKKSPFTIENLEGFDELSVRIIVHGFGSACPHVWIYEMKTALMAVEDCIVICVDWENGANFPNYVRAAANTRLVGKQLAMLINNLKEHKGLNLTRTHIIGFSLGAHVSGFAGAELPGLSRITGLDPAGPLFEAQHPKVRLDNTDAEFVDVIHSNGENLILGGLGSWQPMGHVDFYPNGGRVQTGCSNLFVGAVTDFIWSAQTADEEEGRSLCNHRRAYKFFIDSVASRCMFPAFPCANYDDFLKGKCFPCAQDAEDLEEGVPRCGNMGYYADRSTGRGQLYLVTRDEEPFCAHQFQLQIFNSFNDLPLRTIGRLEATLEGEGGLNETFQISEKDDSEFFAGDIVSKIIVPHPALGFPTTLSLHYKSYSGWLSKGLPHWDIDKVILTDSFGRSHSLCKPSTKLSSGSPVRMKLSSGNCELDNQDEYGLYTVVPPTTTTSLEPVRPEHIENTDEDDGVETVKHRKDIFNLGTSFKLSPNDTEPLDGTNDLPWQPIIEGNSLDKDVGESSRSFSEQPKEIYEPVLPDRRKGIHQGRQLHETSTNAEIMEPVLKATTPRVKKAKEINFNESETTKTNKKLDILKIIPFSTILGDKPKSAAQTQDEPVTVQLFPFRLGDILQRAERYARETLLPLISIEAPKFFGFNVQPQSEEMKQEVRKPRYIPRYEEETFLQSEKSKRKPNRIRKSNSLDGGSSEQRNLFKLMHNGAATEKPFDVEQPQEQPDQQQSQWHSLHYYTNLLTESRALKPEHPDYEPVFINLPTFRPPPQQQQIESTAETKQTG